VGYCKAEADVLDWLRRFYRRNVVADVPDELSACLDCGRVECAESKWQSCPNRLARAAALKAERPLEAKGVPAGD
jgi:hypothetical protein